MAVNYTFEAYSTGIPQLNSLGSKLSTGPLRDKLHTVSLIYIYDDQLHHYPVSSYGYVL